MAPLRLLALLPFALLALAGCIGDSGGSATVTYNATGNGSDDDSTKCDEDGTLVASGEVEEGQVDIRVTDGDGHPVFSRQFDGGTNQEAQSLDGASGTWTIRATRSSDTLLGSEFKGHYSFRLSC
jgi:hypothetical protein